MAFGVFWKHPFLSKKYRGSFFGQLKKKFGFLFNLVSGHTDHDRAVSSEQKQQPNKKTF